MADWILPAVCIGAVLLGIFSLINADMYRTQVKRLQTQRRYDREAMERGGVFTMHVEGLWPDLDEKQRLRDRVAQLESEKDGEVG